MNKCIALIPTTTVHQSKKPVHGTQTKTQFTVSDRSPKKSRSYRQKTLPAREQISVSTRAEKSLITRRNRVIAGHYKIVPIALSRSLSLSQEKHRLFASGYRITHGWAALRAPVHDWPRRSRGDTLARRWCDIALDLLSFAALGAEVI